MLIKLTGLAAAKALLANINTHTDRQELTMTDADWDDWTSAVARKAAEIGRYSPGAPASTVPDPPQPLHNVHLPRRTQC